MYAVCNLVVVWGRGAAQPVAARATYWYRCGPRFRGNPTTVISISRLHFHNHTFTTTSSRLRLHPDCAPPYRGERINTV